MTGAIDWQAQKTALLVDWLRTQPDWAKATPQSRLLDDLGIDGDDTDELLAFVRNELKGDVVGFEHRRYFGSEAWPLGLIGPVVGLAVCIGLAFVKLWFLVGILPFAAWLWLWWRGQPKIEPLTVEQFAAMIRLPNEPA